MIDQVEQIRQKVDIVELISGYITLKKAGRNFKALCPFHSEKTPSMIVSPERQIFKCFGCGESGDVYGFLMKYEKMSFTEALRFLADKTGIKLTSFQPTSQQLEKDKLLGINHLASEFYHYILLSHSAGKAGLRYLLERGISKSSIELFKLGYAPDNWQTLINYLTYKKKYSTYDLEKLGLIIKGKSGKFYDRFRGRIIFPLTDHRNNILGFSGRVLQPDLKGAKYINSPETTLYLKGELLFGLNQTKEHIKKANRAVVSEGEFDVISSFQAGVKNIVAIKGSALTEPQVNLLKRFCQNLVLSLDADLAGDAAVRRGIEIADLAGLNIRVAELAYGKDPDECSRHSPKIWQESVKKAVPIYDYYLKSALKRYEANNPEGKKQISEELLPIFSKISNEVIKAHYLKKLSQALDVSEEVLTKEMARQGKLTKVSLFTSAVKKPAVASEGRQKLLEELMLSLILQSKQQIQAMIDRVNLDYLKTGPVKKIIEKLKKYPSDKPIDLNNFAKKLAPELVETFDRLYLVDIEDILEDKKKTNREFSHTLKELEKLYLKEQLTELTLKIREKERLEENKDLDGLRQSFSELSKKLKEISI